MTTKQKRKKKLKRELLSPEELDEQLRIRYGWLLINELEHDRRMRNKAIRLSRKRKVGYIQ